MKRLSLTIMIFTFKCFKNLIHLLAKCFKNLIHLLASFSKIFFVLSALCIYSLFPTITYSILEYNYPNFAEALFDKKVEDFKFLVLIIQSMWIIIVMVTFEKIPEFIERIHEDILDIWEMSEYEAERRIDKNSHISRELSLSEKDEDK